MFESEDFVALKGGGVLITTQRVADHQAPDWPETTVPKQIHLELAVTDLDAVEKRAVELGAVKSRTQPNPDVWRVLQESGRSSVLPHHHDPRGLGAKTPFGPGHQSGGPKRRSPASPSPGTMYPAPFNSGSTAAQ